jgi:CRISPR/Cas system-associated exonuclease Cas4 (RecB family)
MSNWFSENYKVVNEATILTPNGSSYRPDRVMINDIETLVVDFKFGAPSPSHTKQILRYVYLLKEMGYKKVNGFLWYVDIDKLVEAEE